MREYVQTVSCESLKGQNVSFNGRNTLKSRKSNPDVSKAFTHSVHCAFLENDIEGRFLVSL